MNLIKKTVVFGATACLGITLYASLEGSASEAKAVETNNLTSLTENSQSLNNLEMSINNLLLATNRINFINENLISVNDNYLVNLQNSQQTTRGETSTTSAQGSMAKSQTFRQNSSLNGTNVRNNSTTTSTRLNIQNSQDGNSMAMPFANRMNTELMRLNTNAQDVRSMLLTANYTSSQNINFDDYTKALNMAADTLNTFSETALNKSSNDYPVSKRLAFASIRISNDALEQIKSKISGNSISLNSQNSNNVNLSNTTNTVNQSTSVLNNTNSSTAGNLTRNSTYSTTPTVPTQRDFLNRNMTEYNR